jgi:dehydrogenase/reductase SDR family protein 4
VTLEKYKFQGKVVLITGASRGIGRATALACAELGADVVLSSRKLPDLEALTTEITSLGRRAIAVACHAARTEELEKLVKRSEEEFGHVDILVNNAATNPYLGPTVNAEEKVWDITMGLNMKGYFLLCKMVAQLMIKQGGGSIVNVSSIDGIRRGEGLGIYSISKAGVIMLTEVLAAELSQYNIRVNGVAPGLVRTRLSQALWQDEERHKKAIARIPLRRLGQPEDIASAIVFLASDAAQYITGHTLVVDGGLLLVH